MSKRTKEKDALALTYKQLEELRKKIFTLIHTRGTNETDVDTITAMLLKISAQLRTNTCTQILQTKNGTLNF